MQGILINHLEIASVYSQLFLFHTPFTWISPRAIIPISPALIFRLI